VSAVAFAQILSLTVRYTFPGGTTIAHFRPPVLVQPQARDTAPIKLIRITRACRDCERRHIHCNHKPSGALAYRKPSAKPSAPPSRKQSVTKAKHTKQGEWRVIPDDRSLKHADDDFVNELYDRGRPWTVRELEPAVSKGFTNLKRVDVLMDLFREELKALPNTEKDSVLRLVDLADRTTSDDQEASSGSPSTQVIAGTPEGSKRKRSKKTKLDIWGKLEQDDDDGEASHVSEPARQRVAR